MKFDVTNIEEAKKVLEPLLSINEIPFVIVNNAGFRKDNLLVWMNPDEWKSVIDVNLDGFFNIAKLLLPFMIKNRQGRIVNITSVSGHVAVPGQTNYSAAKAGLIAATRSLANEVAKRNILVNAVSPGFIETDMIKGLPMEEIVKTIPLGRIGKTSDVAELVSFLCSDKAEYITGQVFQVNGGIC
jgi:3-oxoacyl-[acyl-carrier protein] reductase